MGPRDRAAHLRDAGTRLGQLPSQTGGLEAQVVAEELTIRNSSGFHARPASIFVETARRYRSQIGVRSDTRKADGKSILGLMLLGAAAGTRIVIEAQGDDEAEAVAALSALIRGGFGEAPPDGSAS